jgi:hypothetical protein
VAPPEAFELLLAGEAFMVVLPSLLRDLKLVCHMTVGNQDHQSWVFGDHTQPMRWGV